MTKEIALYCMKSASELKKELCEECTIYGQTGSDHCYEDALQYVIAMLEQQPCEDCVSRQAVDDAIYDYSRSCDVNYDQIMKAIDNLPSVTPQPKVGEWLEREVIDSSYKVIDEWQSARCSVCDRYHTTPYMYYFSHYKFCPNCGAQMEVET